MEPAKDNVKVYAAYKYGKPGNAKDPQSQGTVYLRQLKYIPANMGVVLVGEVPADGYKDGVKVDFYLKEKTDDLLPDDNKEALWTKADDYAGQKWNNYLQPTVSANDELGNADTDADGKYSTVSSALQTSIPQTITSNIRPETTISVSSALRRMVKAAQTKLT